ncbi:MAG TPA: sugar phosphate isomerase/epimerase [Streptosporangiaceae bacterium]
MSRAVKAARPLIALSTASVIPDRTPDAFEIAARLGYDGVEVLVSTDAVSQDVEVLRRLADYHGVPVLAVHAPCLLITQRVWGLEPWGKLVRAKEMAEKLGARVVVVHPPFRWQRDYARDFGPGLERMREETDVVFAVENMYPLRAGGAEVAAYAPSWNPVLMDAPHVTLDLSHTAASGSDALAMASDLGDRLVHVHMADGTGVTNRDEHLVPGRGAQPCARLLEGLAADGYPGTVVLEVNTRRAISREARVADLAESLEFTRRHLGKPAPVGDGRTDAGEGRTRAGDGRTPAGGRADEIARPDTAGAPAAGPDPVGPRGSVLPA